MRKSYPMFKIQYPRGASTVGGRILMVLLIPWYLVRFVVTGEIVFGKMEAEEEP